MADNEVGIVPVPGGGHVQALEAFEEALVLELQRLGLPADGICVPMAQRGIVVSNIQAVVEQVPPEQRIQSIYISKFIAAVASGLFDAALSYLWDETIAELRMRVALYDLSYFYDNAVPNPNKRKGLQSEDDLIKIDDSELINGAKGIGLISELGFRHLDYIRFMRNWVSAAHPNQNEITGLQLISMLETCIREVISLPLSNAAIGIKRLLKNVRENSIEENEAKEIGAFFWTLTPEQVANLAKGFFGIYTREDSSAQARQNIRLLLTHLWERVDEATRHQFGIRYGNFVANNDQDQRRLAREFLDAVSAGSYIPDDLRSVEITGAVENLLTAHRNFNNFYTEPPLARELQRLVGESGHIPKQAVEPYVYGLVEVFLTNGSGVAWNADPIYRDLLGQFSQEQALIAALAFRRIEIASRLQFDRCRNQFEELVGMMQGNVAAPAVRELLNAIRDYQGSLPHMKDDTVFMKRIAPLLTIIQGSSKRH
jgi:hypothetical protein